MWNTFIIRNFLVFWFGMIFKEGFVLLEYYLFQLWNSIMYILILWHLWCLLQLSFLWSWAKGDQWMWQLPWHFPWSFQVAFPGNLQLIFILRPSRFIQRTFTDIGIKYYRDEFKMKVPVSITFHLVCFWSGPVEKMAFGLSF